jgi:ATP-dependent RNA/DNA helicase IGHMBP2
LIIFYLFEHKGIRIKGLVGFVLTFYQLYKRADLTLFLGHLKYLNSALSKYFHYFCGSTFQAMTRKDIDEELKKVQSLLRQEKELELSLYKSKMKDSSFTELRKQGLCWYPVKLEKTGFDSGERTIVRISRPKEHLESHQFQPGKPISLFSNAAGIDEEDYVNGVVNQVKEQEMLITLNSDELPDWIHDGYLGVQLLFDEVSYREMEQTMAFLIQTEDKRINELKSILLGNAEAKFTTEHPPVNVPSLNEKQNEALNLVKQALDVAIIHGPPGTGKTTTLVEAIFQVLKEEEQVLVCAPSNAAVDLLVEKLSDKQIEVLRIGNPARVTEEQLSRTLASRIAHHQYYKELRTLRRKADEFRKLARKYKRNFGPAEREQRRLLFEEARKLKTETDQLEFFISNDIISKAQVIASTLVGANNYVLKGKKFLTVFIDEAAQALEPASWIPIIKAERVIFAGDHCQLPPTIKSIEAARAGLDITLFEKAINRNKADVMLMEQYRMNNQIMEFSNRIFYNGQLIANIGVANATIFPEDLPVEFIDTAGTGFFEQVDEETFSTCNQEEASLLIRHFTDYINQLEAMDILKEVRNIGIISPYRAQVALLQETLKAGLLMDQISCNLSINTVDSFQGQERDIIYISLVRSNEKGEIGFLSDIRRMNVAMTRARKKLVIIGDSATICSHSFYDKLLDYVNEIGAYRSAFEFMQNLDF